MKMNSTVCLANRINNVFIVDELKHTAEVTPGAGWVERDETLDGIWQGSDPAASREPDGASRLVHAPKAAPLP